MERESFEDEEVAELLNQHFVSIKVDREERPDVDHIYMTVCQAMTEHGGWPLTIIITPDKKPFFSGTYFPKESKWGRAGLMDILKQINHQWRHNREQLIETGDYITKLLKPSFTSFDNGYIDENILKKAFEQFSKSFDARYGGFGQAPKFPTPHNLMFLLRYWKKNQKTKALEMAEKTLEAMYKGGIYDHIGFGFARYSTDSKWLVPHFEKMLYDNALLAYTYLEAFQATKKQKYAKIAEEIFSYVLRDMTHPEGGFYSAEDADSEGVEGKFYVWTPEEIETILGEKDGKLYCQVYDISKAGNFEGYNIPNLINTPLKEIAKKEGLTLEQLKSRLESSRQKLFTVREKRIHPHKDDKILTSWNALMIAALAKGYQALGNKNYNMLAENAVKFIMNKLRTKEGRLLARFRDGQAAFLAYLDDYAFLIWGLIELYEANFNPKYLTYALELNQHMRRLFWDEINGGFFFYGSDAEELLARPKEVYDGATPSGNSVATLNLLRLARLTGDSKLEEQADKQLKAFAGTINKYPRGYSYFLTAIHFALGPTKEVVIAGAENSRDTQAMLKALQTSFLPETVVILNPTDQKRKELEKLAPFIKEQKPIAEKATAYICENFACRAPVTDLSEMRRFLQ